MWHVLDDAMAGQYKNWIEEIQHDLLNLRDKVESQMNALDSSMHSLKSGSSNCWENANADEHFREIQDKMMANERAQMVLVPLIEQI